MSVQTSYSDNIPARIAGLAESKNISKSYIVGDALPFGRFVKFTNGQRVIKAGADKFETSTNITTGTITMTILKKDLSAGTSTSNSISVAFDTNNNTTYANLETAIEALSNVTATLIDSGGNKRGITITPDDGYEFVVTALSFPVTVTSGFQNAPVGVALLSQLETEDFEYQNLAEVLIKGSVNVATLTAIARTDTLYVKAVGTEAQIGCLTNVSDTTTVALSGVKALSERSNNAVLVQI